MRDASPITKPRFHQAERTRVSRSRFKYSLWSSLVFLVTLGPWEVSLLLIDRLGLLYLICFLLWQHPSAPSSIIHYYTLVLRSALGTDAGAISNRHTLLLVLIAQEQAKMPKKSYCSPERISIHACEKKIIMYAYSSYQYINLVLRPQWLLSLLWSMVGAILVFRLK